ncbi:protein TolR [Candidatus Electronema sp. JC]|uniref:protein TolR n=1 Tax=Candidatus Electronema sp. JC TaxID=3401570 RepID=UPI003AA890BA
MGMGTTGGKGRKSLAAEINVTPLVDVMLVLLIIFMVTAPMMTQGIDINLPKTTGESLEQEAEPLSVVIDSSGQIFLGKNTAPLTAAGLRHELEKLPAAQREEAIYLQADETVSYGIVVQIMAQIKQAGFDKLGMVTQPDEDRQAGEAAQ